MSSITLSAKVGVFTPPRIISFRIWRVEGLPWVIESISLLDLDGSLNLGKIRAISGQMTRVITNDTYMSLPS